MAGHIGRRVLATGQVVYDVCAEIPREPGAKRRQRWSRGLPSEEAARARLSEMLGTAAPAQTMAVVLAAPVVAPAQAWNPAPPLYGGSPQWASSPPPAGPPGFVPPMSGPAAESLSSYLSTWLQAIRPSVRPSTWSSYKDLCEGLMVPRIGSRPLGSISPADLHLMYAELLISGRRDGKGGLSAQSVRYCHTVLHRALGDAVAWGILQVSPAERVKPPRKQVPEMKTWTAEQLMAFLESVSEDWLYPAWVLLATTGMRRGEVFGLKWADVDFTERRLVVRRALIEVR